MVGMALAMGTVVEASISLVPWRTTKVPFLKQEGALFVAYLAAWLPQSFENIASLMEKGGWL